MSGKNIYLILISHSKIRSGRCLDMKKDNRVKDFIMKGGNYYEISKNLGFDWSHDHKVITDGEDGLTFGDADPRFQPGTELGDLLEEHERSNGYWYPFNSDDDD